VNRKEKGTVRHYSLHTYATFEEARQAGKAALDATIAEWKRRERIEQPV
jgi:hypothetical protein